MLASCILLLWVSQNPDPIELPKDVHEFRNLYFGLPVNFPPESKAKVKTVRLFVSFDKGKSWAHEKDYSSEEKLVTFTAPDDGLYWFSLQIVFEDGKEVPSNT